MFKKILIANRGEIACRIITTARKLGIATVAVYSKADQQAKHVRMADEAVNIGESASSKSYLVIEKIIDAAKQTGAEAIHPGYGFLSENPEFVEMIIKAGLVFIGPDAKAIRAMGLKDAAKQLMEKAGVAVVPGYQGSDQSQDILIKEAERIGYPVLIKAHAGGGGKGMRLVENPAMFKEALAAAKREASLSFGDDHCLIEKYIQNPRHIELQIFADHHGNVVHLYERDCSLQRRHQKLVEEAPAPNMPDAMRKAMGQAAITATKAINYRGAGTVEFIVDPSDGLRSDRFWFMEMNTRLQVEHPVSEAITGLDFVEWQLRIAAGETLPLNQKEIPLNGHAIEARICAEDATQGFLPALGAIEYMVHDAENVFSHAPIRLDCGVEAGDAISPYYDPMIGKLIVHANTREAALDQLATSLANLKLAPITTNTEFLSRLIQHEAFKAGKMDTGLIERDFEALTCPTPPTTYELAAAIIGFYGFHKTPDGNSPWDYLRHWRSYGLAEWQVNLQLDGQAYPLSLTAEDDHHYHILYEQEHIPFQLLKTENSDQIIMEWQGKRLECTAVKLADTLHLWYQGKHRKFTIAANASDGTGQALENQIIAPMPGLLQQLHVKFGDQVKAGDVVAILEAMKMEHPLIAPCDGKVIALHAKQGNQISDGALLIELEVNITD